MIGPRGRRSAAWAARVAPALLVAAAAAACGAVDDLVPDTPVPEPQSITDCEPPFVLHEETTLAAIGLDDLQGLEEDEPARRGLFRVTRATVPWEAFGPPGVDPVVPEGQMLCITWADGSGLAMLLAEPFGIAADESDVKPVAGATSIGPAIVVATLLALIGVSWLAFRDRGGSTTPAE